MKIGITGHQKIDDPVWVTDQISYILSLQPSPLIGITSLAAGADQLFAQAVLDAAGHLHVILPFSGYERTLTGYGLSTYNQLITNASSVEVLPAAASDEQSYLTAGMRIVDISDFMIAVWNGLPAAGPGGTADIVAYARLRGRTYIHLNPVDQTTSQ